MSEDPITVSELNQEIKTILESAYVDRINVIGEVSNLRPGNNIYLSLKHQDSIIRVVIWSSYALNCPDLENGKKIIVSGNITCYDKLGYYQLNGKSIQLLGIGELQKEYVLIKSKYENLGYFDNIHKKILPNKLRKIGVITFERWCSITRLFVCS